MQMQARGRDERARGTCASDLDPATMGDFFEVDVRPEIKSDSAPGASPDSLSLCGGVSANGSAARACVFGWICVDLVSVLSMMLSSSAIDDDASMYLDCDF